MKDPQDNDVKKPEQEESYKQPDGAGVPDTSRRSFLGKVGVGGAAAVALAALPLVEGSHGEAEASVVFYKGNNRANDSFNYRKNTAIAEKIDVGLQPDNGDAARFTD